MNKFKYIIITPAKNEEKFIEKTIQSVISQTVLPVRWVIVDDGSTDRTPAVVMKYINDYPFIRLVQRERSIERHFGNKVFAIRRGFEEVKDIDYEYYCNLDADVSFEPDYFEFLLKKFDENPKLGICGGKVYDLIDGQFVPQKYENHSVAGPIQFFRRSCYESFGGYQPFKSGFIDGYGEISARMKGWETKTFTQQKVYHYRPAGTNKGSKMKIYFEGGKFHFQFGYLYFVHLIIALKYILNKPYCIGSLAILWGYLHSKLTNEKRLVSEEFIRYLRKEQINKIKNKLKGMFFHA
uniref:Glycosyltransferase family 2 protein n=1 Tax=Ignavibacterium album TaxID=591197 RepID=A0A832G7H5_9BACT